MAFSAPPVPTLPVRAARGRPRATASRFISPSRARPPGLTPCCAAFAATPTAVQRKRACDTLGYYLYSKPPPHSIGRPRAAASASIQRLASCLEVQLRVAAQVQVSGAVRHADKGDANGSPFGLDPGAKPASRLHQSKVPLAFVMFVVSVDRDANVACHKNAIGWGLPLAALRPAGSRWPAFTCRRICDRSWRLVHIGPAGMEQTWSTNRVPV